MSKTSDAKKAHNAKTTKNGNHPRIRWVFRCNASINDEPNEVTDREQHAQCLLKKLEPLCTAVAFQLESAPSTGYLHYQGCVEFSNKRRFDWIQTHIQKFEYLAPMQGTPKQAWNYSTKLETRVAGPWTWGEPYGEDLKKPTQLFVEAVIAGATDAMLVDEHPSCFLRHEAEKIRQAKRIYVPPPSRFELYGSNNMVVFVFFGNPGTGKSYTARELYPDIYVPPIRTSKSGNFWLTTDGNLRRNVLLDDFDGNMTLKALNQMLDPYPQLLEKKGGNVWWMPEVVILTTNVVPGSWYNYDSRQNVRLQVNRRITMCFDFNTPGGKALREGISVEDLERRYTDNYPIFNANKRMASIPPLKFTKQHVVSTSPAFTPPHRSPVTPKEPSFKRPAPYTWSNDKRTLTVYKPLIQPPPISQPAKREQVVDDGSGAFNDCGRGMFLSQKPYVGSSTGGYSTIEGDAISVEEDEEQNQDDFIFNPKTCLIDIYGDSPNSEGGEIVEWDSPVKQPLDESDDTVPKRWY